MKTRWCNAIAQPNFAIQFYLRNRSRCDCSMTATAVVPHATATMTAGIDNIQDATPVAIALQIDGLFVRNIFVKDTRSRVQR
jgi:hypothetical protein